MDPEDLWDTVLAEVLPAQDRHAQRGVLTLPDAYYQSAQTLAPAFDHGITSTETDPISSGRVRDSGTSKGLIRNLQLATEVLPGSMGAVERASPSTRIHSLPPSLVPDHAGLEAQRWSPQAHVDSVLVQHMGSNYTRNSGSTAGALRHKVMFDDTRTATVSADGTPPNQFKKPSGGIPWARRPILRSKTVPKLVVPQAPNRAHGDVVPQWNSNLITQQTPSSPDDTAADSDEYNSSYRRRNDFRRARTYGGAPSSVGLDAVQMGSFRRRAQALREPLASSDGATSGPCSGRCRLSGLQPSDGMEERSSWRPTPQWRQQLENKVAEMAQQRGSMSGALKSSSLDRTLSPANGVLSSSGRHMLQQHRLSSLSSSRGVTENGVAADAELPTAFGLVGRADAALPLKRNPAAGQLPDERSSQRSSLYLPPVRNSSTSGF